ncbi:MAG: ROK family transcriptional regulator [Sphingomonas phyllosphaerae]
MVAGDGRDARLSRSLSGTNLARAGDYNLRTVLQAIRLSPGATRADIARQTGLTPATIGNISGRLVDMGLVHVTGRKIGGRGQPALQLAVDPEGAFGIGINIDRDHLTLVTLDLNGVVRSRVCREVTFALPDDVLRFVAAELDQAIAAGGIDRDRILGVGVALPDELGNIAMPGRPSAYGIWAETSISHLLADLLPWPIHCDNDAAAAALGEAEYGTAFDNPCFFYLLVSAGLGGALVIDRSYHRGASNRSGEIGLIPDPGAGTPGARVQDTVSVTALLDRLAAAGHRIDDVDALDDLPDGADAIVDAWLAASVRALTGPLVTLACLLDPDAVLIGGRLPIRLIERLAGALTDALTTLDLPARATIMPAVIARDAAAVGAAILPFLDRLLPSDSILIQAGR